MRNKEQPLSVPQLCCGACLLISAPMTMQVKSIDKMIRDEDCYKGLDSMVKSFTASLPLVAELRSPAMRERHWDALMAATKKKIALEDPAFSLQQLLDLQLHKFEEEVGEIVDQASKEEKMETALVRLGETWAKMEFQFVQFGSTNVYTVRMVEEDFEALEDDQVLHTRSGQARALFCVMRLCCTRASRCSCLSAMAPLQHHCCICGKC